MRLRTFALLLGVPLLLMGALIVGLRIGEGELEESVRNDTAAPAGPNGGGDRDHRAGRRPPPGECA